MSALTAANGYLLHRAASSLLSHECQEDIEVTPGSPCLGTAMPLNISVTIPAGTECPGGRVCNICLNGTTFVCRQMTTGIGPDCFGNAQQLFGACRYWGQQCGTCGGVPYQAFADVTINPTSGLIDINAVATVFLILFNPPNDLRCITFTGAASKFRSTGDVAGVAGLSTGGSATVPEFNQGPCGGGSYFTFDGLSASVVGGP